MYTETPDKTMYIETPYTTMYIETPDKPRYIETPYTTMYFETPDKTRYIETPSKTRYVETPYTIMYIETAYRNKELSLSPWPKEDSSCCCGWQKVQKCVWWGDEWRSFKKVKAMLKKNHRVKSHRQQMLDKRKAWKSFSKVDLTSGFKSVTNALAEGWKNYWWGCKIINLCSYSLKHVSIYMHINI